MDTELLKTFNEVARTRHFGRAAENLYLTQSAVSSRVRQLESLLGTELFSRQRNNIRLTAAGEKLIPLAESCLLLEQRMRQEVALSDDTQHQISIGATPNLWDAFLQHELLRQVCEQQALAFNAVAHSSQTLIRQVLEHSLDIAFVFDAPKVDELVTQEVMTVGLHLVGAASLRDQDWQQAMSHGYIMVDWGLSFQMQQAQYCPTNTMAVLQTNTGRIALDCLLAKSSCAYLPLSLVQPYLDTNQLHVFDQAPVLQRTVYASFNAQHDQPQRLQQMIARLCPDAITAAQSLAPVYDADDSSA